MSFWRPLARLLAMMSFRFAKRKIPTVRRSFRKIIYPIGCENQIHVEWASLDLLEILVRDDFVFEFRTDFKAQFREGGGNPSPIFWRPRRKDIDVLCRPRIAEKNRTALAKEEIFYTRFLKRTGDFLRLERVKVRTAHFAAGLKPRYSGRFAAHHSRYSAIVANERHGASSRTGLYTRLNP